MALSKSGIDTSKLNPYRSDLYDGKVKSLSPILNLKNNKLFFKSSLKSPSEFYRASVTDGTVNYTLAASLYNHQTLLRAALLRLIGYNVDLPKYKKTQKIFFKSIEQKKLFIESLSQSTLLAKSRWIPDEAEILSKELFLTLKGFLLEPASRKAVPVYGRLRGVD
jgi:hypothetical protein